MQKAVGYIRVSTQGQVEEGVSLDAQRAKIEAWCHLNDAELAAVFTDAGLSGASMGRREGLQAALKATGKGMVLVAYSISRLARSTRDMLEIAEQLERKGADLVSLTEMRSYFPDSEIVHERFAGLTKSLIAIRT